jgi:hypothetical protein
METPDGYVCEKPVARNASNAHDDQSDVVAGRFVAFTAPGEHRGEVPISRESSHLTTARVNLRSSGMAVFALEVHERSEARDDKPLRTISPADLAA